MNKLFKIKNFLLDLFFPKFCLGCNREGDFLCENCRTILDINQHSYCLCDKPLRLPPNSKIGKCEKCQNKKISGLFCALSYQENQLTKKLIYQFKYQPYLKNLAEILASLIAEHLILINKNSNEIWENSVLIPVPIHKKRFNERGYNQSVELAKELAKILKTPVVLNCLIKIKSTKPQMELKKEERQKNLEKAFIIKNTDQIRDKKIFLVDDVYTTGSTMQECAKILKQAGAKQVWGICIARDTK